jgi:hypothetical protein
VTEHGEAIEVEMVGQVLDVARPALVSTSRIERAVPVARPIRGDAPDSVVRGDLAHDGKFMACPGRSVKRDHWRAAACAQLDPCQLTTISELKHPDIGHSAS